MTPRWDVLGLGAVAVDDLLYVADYPQPDTKTRVLSQRRDGGGLAGTALVAAARLGAKTGYCGVLGDDELSRFTIQKLESQGVDCSSVFYQETARPFHSTIIVVSATQQRTILFSSSGVTGPQAHQITHALISNCRVLFLDDTVVEAGIKSAELAKAHGIPVIADFEGVGETESSDLMRLVDHLIVGVGYAQRVTGIESPPEMVQKLAIKAQACCAVTAGGEGCWYSAHGDDVRHFPAFRVDVVDTTGCGDVFHGAYAAAIAQDQDVDRAIEIASAAAALKATAPGGQSGIPDGDAVNRFLANYTPT
ncbi:MAG: hypothetical protein J5I90_19595 [Caldilineales bacterium]|nr:hypothetical protein [Caldilineales bacterium]